MSNPPSRIKSRATLSGAAKRPKPEWLKKLQWVAETIDRYFTANAASLDENAKRVFGRLKADDRVPEALASIAKSESDLNRLLRGCLEADELSRTFREKLNNERRIVERAKRLQLKLSELRFDLDELEALFDEEIWSYNQVTLATILKPGKSIDRLSAHILLPDQEVEKVNHAFYILKESIADRKQIASETILRFGATRKSARTNENAAQTAAIGWLAEAVERVASKPCTRHAAVLAEATLAIRDITEDRVREALRTRRREWRAHR
jgi:hypothetical protein